VTDGPNLFDLDRREAETYFSGLDEKPFRASQLLSWLHQHGVVEFDAMTNLSKALRNKLELQARLQLPEIVTEQTSSDGTRKWLLQVDAANRIETVFIPEPGRGTLCVSSQVGCPLDCSFCATARQGFSRNLTTAEIIGQVRVAWRALEAENPGQRTITNVVLMGMGEPLLNFEPVVRAMRIMQDDNAYGLAARRITLSTAGHVPGIDRLRETEPVSLAVSLHAPEDGLRDQLVPINRKYPIRELLDACRRYVSGQRRARITFEYVMLNGINDTPAHARQLAGLLRDIPAKINLIPFNPVAGIGYNCSSEQTIRKFRDILIDAGLLTLTRKTRGDDIDAACGQLVGKVQARARRHRQSAHNA